LGPVAIPREEDPHRSLLRVPRQDELVGAVWTRRADLVAEDQVGRAEPEVDVLERLVRPLVGDASGGRRRARREREEEKGEGEAHGNEDGGAARARTTRGERERALPYFFAVTVVSQPEIASSAAGEMVSSMFEYSAGAPVLQLW